MPGQTLPNREDASLREVLATLHDTINSLDSLLSRVESDTQSIAVMKNQLIEMTSRINPLGPLLIQVAVIEQRVKSLEEDSKNRTFNLAGMWQFWAVLIAALLGLMGTIMQIANGVTRVVK